jgi:hypothetical protein
MHLLCTPTLQQSRIDRVTVKSYRVGIDMGPEFTVQDVSRMSKGRGYLNIPSLNAFKTAWCLFTQPSL